MRRACTTERTRVLRAQRPSFDFCKRIGQAGVALVVYRNRLRMNRFMDLQAGAVRSKMLTAALEAGFGSYAQFHRVFRQMMGCGPWGYDFERAGGRKEG